MNDVLEMANRIMTGRPLDGSDPPDITVRDTGPGIGMRNKKHISKSLSVHPSQAAEFNEAARASGNTGVEFDLKTGDMTYGTRRDQAKEAKRRGMFNKDGGYSDAQPDNI